VPRGAKSRMRRTETPKRIWIKFCTVVDIADLVTHTNFGDHRLRGFWVAEGQISPSPIDFHRRPHNTLALSCECVIYRPMFILSRTARWCQYLINSGFLSFFWRCQKSALSAILKTPSLLILGYNAPASSNCLACSSAASRTQDSNSTHRRGWPNRQISLSAEAESMAEIVNLLSAETEYSANTGWAKKQPYTFPVF